MFAPRFLVDPTLPHNGDTDSSFNVVLHETDNDINKREDAVVVRSVDHGDSVGRYSVVITCGRNRDITLMRGGLSVP
jgi:hypothetical protein